MVLDELMKLFSSCLVDIRTIVNTIEDEDIRRDIVRVLSDYRNRMENLNERELD